MKKIILLLALILLVGCQKSPEVQIIPEAAPEVNDEMEQSRIEALQKELADAKVECSAFEEEFNNTLCFAIKAAKYRGLILHQNVTYPMDIVKAFCAEANNSDMCYYYIAVYNKDSIYCTLVEDVTGCNLISDVHFCNDISNKNACLMNRAFMVQFVDLSESARICKILPAEYHQEIEDDFSCLDIEFNVTEQTPYQERFMMTYYLSQMAEFEVERVRVRR